MKKMSSRLEKLLKDPVGYANTALSILTTDLENAKSKKKIVRILSKIEGWLSFIASYQAEKEQLEKEIQNDGTNPVVREISTEDNSGLRTECEQQKDI